MRPTDCIDFTNRKVCIKLFLDEKNKIQKKNLSYFLFKFKSDHILEATNCELMMPKEKQS
jgi:hypothetical protein